MTENHAEILRKHPKIVQKSCMDDHPWMTIFGRLQQIAEGFLLRIHLLSGLYGSWSRKYDPGIADQGTDAARRARMQRRGYMGRAHYGASQSGRLKQKKSKRFAI